MRILAVTLYAGENELDACLASVARQSLPAAEHLVLRHLPKREAHETLFGTFVRRRDEFDLLIKVDADMVLKSDRLFEGVARRFEADPAMQVLAIKIDDWYTRRRVSGLNCFRNTIDYRPNGDAVFTDRFGYDRRAYRRDDRDLAPAADHCPDPAPFQALHFGVHRGVKAVVAAARGMHETAWMRHRDIELTWRHFQHNPDPRLALACLGGEWGLQGRFGADQLDYDNAAVRAAFETWVGEPVEAVAEEVRGLRSAEFGRDLPWPVRHELRRGGWNLPWRLAVPLPARAAAAKLLGRTLGGCKRT